MQKKIHKIFSRKAAAARQRLRARREKWRQCWFDIRDYPAKVKAYKERMAATKIQKAFRGMIGRRKALIVKMQKRLRRTTQVKLLSQQ